MSQQDIEDKTGVSKRSISRLEQGESYLWGTRIGIIHQDFSKDYASFEYDKDFVDSGIELSPLRMPLGRNI